MTALLCYLLCTIFPFHYPVTRKVSQLSSRASFFSLSFFLGQGEEQTTVSLQLQQTSHPPGLCAAASVMHISIMSKKNCFMVV